MPLTIVQAGEPVLRRPARPLRPNEIRSREIRELIQQMKETMYAAPGVGLAAPQIGQGIQLAVIEDRPEYTRDWTPEQLADRERNVGAVSSDHQSQDHADRRGARGIL